jgi:O-antigen/teichoic acid export membrane protein
VGIWVARYLGPDQFGLFSYAQSFVGLFTALATLGLDGIVVRELVKNENRKVELISTTFWLKIIGTIGVFIVLAIAINFTSNDSYTNTLVFIIASATIFQSFNVIDFYFQSKVLSKYVVYSNMISLLVSSLIKIYLILHEAPLVAFAWVVFFDSFVLACGLIYFYIKKNSIIDISYLAFNKKEAIYLLKESFPLIISTFVASIYLQIDQIMIKELLNTEAVGLYSAAIKISEIFYIIPIVITASLFPAIVNSKKQSIELYNFRLQKLYDLMIWTSIFIAIIVTFLFNKGVSLLYGKDFMDANSILIIHIWAGVIIFYGHVKHKWAINENLNKEEAYMVAIGAISNIFLNYIFIPLYGVIGAAYATIISYFIGYVLISVFFHKFYITLTMLGKSLILPFIILLKKITKKE